MKLDSLNSLSKFPCHCLFPWLYPEKQLSLSRVKPHRRTYANRHYKHVWLNNTMTYGSLFLFIFSLELKSLLDWTLRLRKDHLFTIYGLMSLYKWGGVNPEFFFVSFVLEISFTAVREQYVSSFYMNICSHDFTNRLMINPIMY